MYFKIVFLIATTVAACLSTDVDFNSLKCKSMAPPANATLHCKQQSGRQEVRCQLKCKQGYDVKYLAARSYVCHTDGTWSADPPSADSRWPDCKIYGPNDPVP